MSDHRLLIVSNRLPVSGDSDGVRLVPAAGGLVTGMRPWHERSGGVWIGWPDLAEPSNAAQKDALDREFTDRGLVPVYLSSDEVDRYYHGFANRVIWPLFHYLIDRVPVDAADWDAYRRVNEIFADAIAREYRPHDVVWVHDYQLMLVPALLRERLPSARIGFFLHIPFPSSEVFRTLPWRSEILTGLLGADLIGFHTFAYMRHFVSSLLHVEGVEADLDRLRVGDREVELGTFPMGVDAAGFAALAREPDVIAEVKAIRRAAGDRQIVLGVDRLDYTKGIPRRLEAIERLLSHRPELRDTMRYIQVAVPSRGGMDAYQQFRRDVEERVGRINGACGTLRSAPVHYVHRSVSPRELVALYCAADVMLVTPLRDGMNLVSKEFAASRVDDDGVLVLSELAGAASELCGAVVVNPYDVDAVGAAVGRALSMPLEERTARMKSMRQRVVSYDVHAWAESFMSKLVPDDDRRHETAGPPRPSLYAAIAEAQRGATLNLLLDYDGTLVPLARSPELAAPDPDLMLLFEALAAAPGIELALVTGRPRAPIEEWFGHLPITLWAEHGFWHRAKGQTWQPAAWVDPAWSERVLRIFEQFTAMTPGSQIETKTASLTWHYRAAQREFGARQAHELRMLLGDALSNQPLEVLEGKKAIEVRLRGVSKALVARRPQDAPGSPITVAFGDDRTDEELFRALPESSITVAVGHPFMGAKYCVDSYRTVRRILRLMLSEAVTQSSGVQPGGTSGNALSA